MISNIIKTMNFEQLNFNFFVDESVARKNNGIIFVTFQTNQIS